MKLIYALLAFSLITTSALHADHKIGVILPMTGDFARYGERVRAGLESSRTEGVQFVYEDEGCSPHKAITAYKKLSSFDKVEIFIGPWCGSPQVAVASQLSHSSQVAILGSSAPRRVFELSGGRMLSVQHSIEEESAMNASEVYRAGARNVVILFFENDFSRAHEAAFREHFKGKVLETLVYSTPEGSSLRSLVSKIKQLKPDALYVPDAFPLMHGLFAQLSALGLGELKVFSVYSAQSEDVVRVAGAAGEGMMISYPAIEGDALEIFPQLASKVVMDGLSSCADESPDCFINAIKKRYDFDDFGVLKGKLGFKVLRNGKFEWVKTDNADAN